MLDENLVIEVAQGNQAAVQLLLKFNDNVLMQKLKDDGITGPNLWLLYKDECGEDIEITRAIIEAGTAYATLKGNRNFTG